MTNEERENIIKLVALAEQAKREHEEILAKHKAAAKRRRRNCQRLVWKKKHSGYSVYPARYIGRVTPPPDGR